MVGVQIWDAWGIFHKVWMAHFLVADGANTGWLWRHLLVLELIKEVATAHSHRLGVELIQKGQMTPWVRALLFETAFLIEECLQVLRAFIHEAPAVQSRRLRLITEGIGTHHLFHCCHCLLLLEYIRKDIKSRTVSLLHTQHSVILVLIRWHWRDKVRLWPTRHFLGSHLERFHCKITVADVSYSDVIVL